MRPASQRTQLIVLIAVLIGVGVIVLREDEPAKTQPVSSPPTPPRVLTAAEKKAEARQRVENRKEFARSYENRLLDKGMNVDVYTSDTNDPASNTRADHLTLRWALVSKVTAHQMEKDQDLFFSLRVMGFRKFTITDGFHDSFSWDIGGVP